MADWLDGYADPIDERDLSSGEDTAATGPDLIRCRHCGSLDLRPRTTRGDSDSVQFLCHCGKHTTVHLPHGYAKCFRACTSQEPCHAMPFLSASDDRTARDP